MIFDAHTYVGHFPFRQIRHNTLPQLAAFLQKSGVGRALVANLNGVFYRNTMDGNTELARQLGALPPELQGFFAPACIINPTYPEWQADMETCVTQLGFQAVQLYPYYHGYYLNDAPGVEALEAAARLGVPVHLPCAIENIRQKHELDTSRNLTPDEVAGALRKNTTANVLITNGSSVSFATALQGIARTGRVLFDFNRLEVFNGDLEKLVQLAGADNVIFGSLAPMQYIEHQLVKLQFLQADDAVTDKICHKNMETLLHAAPPPLK